jgi:hypothetical protein
MFEPHNNRGTDRRPPLPHTRSLEDPTRDATAADLAADEKLHRISESAYRRGFNHGIALCYDLVGNSSSVAQARRTIGKADDLAYEHRSLRRFPGRPPLVDDFRRRLMRRKGGV